MGPVWALPLLLLPIQGAEPVCDVRQNKTQCYGALGGTIEIRLMDSGSTTFRCIWKKNQQTIFDWRNNTVRRNRTGNRSEFNASTGIFKMFKLTKHDTDSYTLEFSGSDGKYLKTITHQLTIEAPVSSVQLQRRCLSQGEIMVTCTVEEGDSPEFSWTLNGQNLTDSHLISKNDETKSITLRQDTEGLLRCSVRNHISELHQELNISTCDHWPLVIGAVVGVLIIGAVAVVVVYVWKKKCQNNKDEEHELTYADVRVLQRPGTRHQPQASEMEVEYGQVKFSTQRHYVPEAPDDSCIYAQVQK